MCVLGGKLSSFPVTNLPLLDSQGHNMAFNFEKETLLDKYFKDQLQRTTDISALKTNRNDILLEKNRNTDKNKQYK